MQDRSFGQMLTDSFLGFFRTSPPTFTERLNKFGDLFEGKIPETFCDSLLSCHSEIMDDPFLADTNEFIDRKNIAKFNLSEHPAYENKPFIFDVLNIKEDILKRNQLQTELENSDLPEEKRDDLLAQLNELNAIIESKQNEFVLEDVNEKSALEIKIQTEALGEEELQKCLTDIDTINKRIEFKLTKCEREVKKLQEIESFVERIEKIEKLKSEIEQLEQREKPICFKKRELAKLLDKHISLTTIAIKADDTTPSSKDIEIENVLGDYKKLRLAYPIPQIFSPIFKPWNFRNPGNQSVLSPTFRFGNGGEKN